MVKDLLITRSLSCLYSAFGAAAVAMPMLASGAAKAAEDPSVASSRMSYSRFLEYLEMGRVKKVGAIVTGSFMLMWQS